VGVGHPGAVLCLVWGGWKPEAKRRLRSGHLLLCPPRVEERMLPHKNSTLVSYNLYIPIINIDLLNYLNYQEGWLGWHPTFLDVLRTATNSFLQSNPELQCCSAILTKWNGCIECAQCMLMALSRKTCRQPHLPHQTQGNPSWSSTLFCSRHRPVLSVQNVGCR